MKNQKLKVKNQKVSRVSWRSQGGQAMMITVTFVLFGALGIIGGVAGPVLSDTLLARQLERSTDVYFSSESSVEDAAYRIKNDMNLSSSEQLVLNGATSTATITDISTAEKQVVAQATSSRVVRTVTTDIAKTKTISFSFGAHAGEGGIEIRNTGSIIGDAYSNGPILSNSSAVIQGTSTVSAGEDGIIIDADISGDAHAHTIENSFIDGDAYYQVDNGLTVVGTRYASSTNQPKLSLPISDEIVEGWKQEAESGGTYDGSCPYQINSTVTVGPVKVPCDFEIQGSASVSIAGPIWVEGDVTVQNNSTVTIAGEVSDHSLPIIADNPANPTGSGTIEIENNSTFVAPEGTAVIVISQNTSGEEGGGTEAIVIRNGVSGDLIPYALHGIVNMQNNVALSEVAAYKIILSNSAQVTYSGVINNVSVPVLDWNIQDWKEQ